MTTVPDNYLTGPGLNQNFLDPIPLSLLQMFLPDYAKQGYKDIIVNLESCVLTIIINRSK